MLLVDTNVVSEFMRPRPAPAVIRWASGMSRFALSVITVEEVWYGLSIKQSARLEKWFEDFTRDFCDILPVTNDIARRCARLRASLRAVGKPRTQADLLIAATAAEHDLALVTRNQRDFDGCEIRLIDPFIS